LTSQPEVAVIETGYIYWKKYSKQNYRYLSSMVHLWCFNVSLFHLQINVAVQCLSTDFSSQKGVKVSTHVLGI